MKRGVLYLFDRVRADIFSVHPLWNSSTFILVLNRPPTQPPHDNGGVFFFPGGGGEGGTCVVVNFSGHLVSDVRAYMGQYKWVTKR